MEPEKRYSIVSTLVKTEIGGTHDHIGNGRKSKYKKKVDFRSARCLVIVKCTGRLGTIQDPNQQETLQRKHK